LERRLFIVTGGQSGVDQAGLDVAIARNIPYSGWCPRGGLATNFTEPPGLLVKYPRLRETPLKDVRQRTAWNVRDSHASLLFYADTQISPGTSFALQCALFAFSRPVHVVEYGSAHLAESLARAQGWLAKVFDALAQDPGHPLPPPTADNPKDPLDPFVLNVGGPRKTEAEGIYDKAYVFLDKLLSSYAPKC
jgi:Circularly permutated YpsA SLOG family